MNRSDVLRIFIAAQDDPVLASWAAVAHEHRQLSLSDVSPYECVEMFEALYNYGFINSSQYHHVDVKQVFLSGRRPPEGEVQRVLAHLRILPDPTHHHQEPPPMSRAKLPLNPFGGDDTALAPRESNGGGLVNSQRPPSLSSRSPAGGMLNPFSNETLPQNKRTLAMDGFSPRSGGSALACQEPNELAASPFADVQLQIYCCGVPLAMEVQDMQAEGPDSIPGGQITVLDRLLHGTCSKCKREHHHSVGEVVPHEVYR